ncbi:hypothetical protein PHLGIDRAFT_129268 [Phlebiopsis gigantea 11061_1 CR5-6]|uniref:Uncharacterized protein n=1 Tax=Phlebiopsis gigantea (strain 11061_1 CR5-6) TaxID=745531 RepID=A0A0C3S7R1_PHLG1|nr:hypothetical protein PHLGIDRAFT_129268 [Phlebiopsis gigantea 11061_1 CR5-6]
MYSSIRRRVTIGDLDEQEDALAFAAELLEGRLKDNKASTYASFATSFYLWGTRHRSSALQECSSFQELQDEFLELIACDLDFPADPVLEALHTTKPPLVEAAPIVDVALKAEETAEGACAVEIIPVTEVLPMEVVDTLDAEFEDMVLRFQRLTLDDPIVDYAVEMMLQIFKGWV